MAMKLLQILSLFFLSVPLTVHLPTTKIYPSLRMAVTSLRTLTELKHMRWFPFTEKYTRTSERLGLSTAIRTRTHCLNRISWNSSQLCEQSTFSTVLWIVLLKYCYLFFFFFVVVETIPFVSIYHPFLSIQNTSHKMQNLCTRPIVC